MNIPKEEIDVNEMMEYIPIFLYGIIAVVLHFTRQLVQSMRKPVKVGGYIRYRGPFNYLKGKRQHVRPHRRRSPRKHR
jgi:hypothetical protein